MPDPTKIVALTADGREHVPLEWLQRWMEGSTRIETSDTCDVFENEEWGVVLVEDKETGTVTFVNGDHTFYGCMPRGDLTPTKLWEIFERHAEFWGPRPSSCEEGGLPPLLKSETVDEDMLLTLIQEAICSNESWDRRPSFAVKTTSRGKTAETDLKTNPCVAAASEWTPSTVVIWMSNLVTSPQRKAARRIASYIEELSAPVRRPQTW